MRQPCITLVAASAALSATAMAAHAAPPQPYVVAAGRDCAGYPRLQIDTAAGVCAGLVLAPEAGKFASRQVRAPRALLPLEGGDWLVVDLGGWGQQTGAVWRLTPTPGAPRLRKLLGALAMPHGLARGPDGKVYVGEMTRVFRFDPDAADPAATVEPVISDLPDNRLHDNRHPLSSILFDKDGALIVNVGAPSDDCLTPDGKRDGVATCAQSDKGQAAALRRYAYLGDGRWSPHAEVLATGLRNAVALARHASGTIVQGENSYDFNDPAQPYDEINLITAGGFYGWPYCFNRQSPTPGWAGAFDCGSEKHRAPAVLLPPHAAPISMSYYEGAMFPRLSGRLVMSWRGYRSTGARVVAYAVDAKGAPQASTGARYGTYAIPGKPAGRRPYDPSAGRGAEPLVLTTGWDKAPGKRPRGAPAGLAVAPDGAIWVTDDKNGAIVRLAADGPEERRVQRGGR